MSLIPCIEIKCLRLPICKHQPHVLCTPLYNHYSRYYNVMGSECANQIDKYLPRLQAVFEEETNVGRTMHN